LLLVAALLAVVVGALVIGAVARGLDTRGEHGRAADLGALAGARAMRDAYPRLFEPPLIDDRPNPLHLERAAYLALGIAAAEATARRNGAHDVRVSFPHADPIAPVRIRVAVEDSVVVRGHGEVPAPVAAEAELAPPGGLSQPSAGEGQYDGPLAYRQGKPMRPDVAEAFDRMAAAARGDGVDLIVTSGFRTDAEQAVLFAAHPDPKWVAPPGKSLHRLATELDLGPPAAYGWLARNAERFHFVQRYSWEPWHFGFTLNAGSSSLGYGGHDGSDGESAHGVPDFVPARFAPAFAKAAQRWNVSAALLAAQAWKESNFNLFARSGAGAQGIAQFMPGTAHSYGLADPFDPEQAIDAQAHYMRDLLRCFASVPLALAAYNAGEGRVAECMCIPPIPETQAYVAAILGMLRGAGDQTGLAAGGLLVRLVR
jgi:hypothetical protein